VVCACANENDDPGLVGLRGKKVEDTTNMSWVTVQHTVSMLRSLP
jgi:hypothetical protein